jgi:hypothetical protein
LNKKKSERKTTCPKTVPPRQTPNPDFSFLCFQFLCSYSTLSFIIIFSPHINLQSITMDLSELPVHEVRTAFESHPASIFQIWVLDRSTTIIKAARRIHGDAQRSSGPPHNISDTDAVIVNNMLGYVSLASGRSTLGSKRPII